MLLFQCSRFSVYGMFIISFSLKLHFKHEAELATDTEVPQNAAGLSSGLIYFVLDRQPINTFYFENLFFFFFSK